MALTLVFKPAIVATSPSIVPFKCKTQLISRRLFKPCCKLPSKPRTTSMPSSVAQEAVGMSQAFHAGGTGGLPPTAGAFPSQAQKRLLRYSSDGGSSAVSHPGARGNCGTQHL